MKYSIQTIQKTDILIIGAGFAGLYLSHILQSEKHIQHNKFLIVAPDKKTVSDKSYYNFRSRGIKQTSLKNSMQQAGQKKNNAQLVNIFVNNIDDEITRLSYIVALKPSYLGVQVMQPKTLLNKLKNKAKPYRLIGTVKKVQKINREIIVETTMGTIYCKKLVFCGGGNRARFSTKFSDEKISYDIFQVARDVGCTTKALNKVMYHPFYSNGVCVPSDSLFDFDIVDQDGNRLSKTCQLLRAHNAHHCFEEICEEFEKTKQRFAVKGTKKIKLEIEPHYTLGGIKINKYGQTNIKHIYALGECAYGTHGYGRLGGCALSEIIVMARVIARNMV